MEAYANVLLFAIPAFIVLIVIEYIYGYWVGKQTLRGFDTISSFSSGVTNTVKSILGLAVAVVSYDVLVDHLAIFHFENSVLLFFLTFIAIDFAGYWGHRLSHSINIFWNRHVVHHSSEEFNLPCALRQEIADIVTIGSLFLFPAALLGIPTELIATIAPLHLFMQFWYHTRHVPKLGFLEYIIITPSQHRVHHAINEVYLDKNLGQILSIWDRLFGTFQEELDDVPCVYGVIKAPRTWNPVKINFQHLWQLTKDAWRTDSYTDKLRIWFMPTGWRPSDVRERYEVENVIDDPYNFEKYDTPASGRFKAWVWFQFIVVNLFSAHLLWNFAAIGFPSLFVYGGFIFLSVYSYCSLMDREWFAPAFEVARLFLGVAVIYYLGDWFLLDLSTEIGSTVVLVYLVFSVGITFVLSREPKREIRYS